MNALAERPAGWLFVILVLLLPFEPRPPALRFFGLQVTLLEAVGALAMAVGALAWRRSLRERLRERPLALLALAGYALTHLASAALAEPPRALPLKFALRMMAMAAFGWLAAAAPAGVRRRALLALVAAGTLVASLSVAEGVSVRALDPFLDLFRESPFTVSGVRRATGGSEYPNQAGAFVMYALLVWAGVGGSWSPALRFALASLLSAGLLFTYSRGALAAALLSLLALALVPRRPRSLPGPPAALATLILATLCFGWWGDVFRQRLEGEGTRAGYGATYEPEERSFAMRPGESRRARVRITNAGRKAWARGGEFQLSYHWYDVARSTLADGGRTNPPRDLEPGQSAVVEALIVAPARVGRYLLIWDMVHEKAAWFSGQGVPPVSVGVVVGEPPAADAAGDAEPLGTGPGFRPERAELWKAAVSMWRQHPLLGVGPDNFRWLYGRYLHQPFWDRRVFANNTLLEAAATTGSLGALALVLTFAFGLLSGYRLLALPEASTRGEPLALLGVLLGLLIHGLADYVLAFTGHYLLLGLAAGFVSARETEPGIPLRT